MSDLIAPHGGLREPVNRTVPENRRDEFLARAAALPPVVVRDADLSTVFRIGDGALSPIVGPMNRGEYDRVLAEGYIERDGKKYAWTIPLSLPVTDEEAASLGSADAARLVDAKGETVGILEVGEVFDWDKPAYIRGVYQTDRTDHPGARMVTEDERGKLVGGELEVLPQPRHPEFGKYQMTPRETRAFFAEKGWERVVAFQTRNPLHRAHEYALVYGGEEITRAGHKTGIVLNPLVGETKSDDVDAVTRMKTYEALVVERQLGEGDKDEELWKKVGYDLNDAVALIALDIKMFYGGPKEAVMHGIYRQNYGFTNIIIGRKHADAPYDDGSDIWDPLDAQRIFDHLGGELLIEPVKVGFAAYYEELGRVGLVDECSKKGWKPIPISGRDVRQAIAEGRLPDPRVMRESTARILIDAQSS
jgi:sulfate adenylyltransferase